MIRISDCAYCIHRRENKGYQMTCDAFPEGVPYEFDDNNVKEIKECNNGIGYKEK